ncbi:putative lectin-like protein kinase [Hordeum vulgare]|nr:putative lectin-like protein kinase [Hordeum vulgare]
MQPPDARRAAQGAGHLAILLRSMPTPAVLPFKPSFVCPATDGGFDTMSTMAGSTSSTVVTSTSTWSDNFARGSQNHAPEPEQGVNYRCVGKRKGI